MTYIYFLVRGLQHIRTALISMMSNYITLFTSKRLKKHYKINIYVFFSLKIKEEEKKQMKKLKAWNKLIISPRRKYWRIKISADTDPKIML